MGKRGPRPTPTATLKRRGSWRAKARKAEPQPPSGVPACPQWLSLEARQIWDALVPHLHAAGLATSVDTLCLARYCLLYIRWRRAERALRRYGQVMRLGRRKGYAQVRPEAAIARNLHQALLQIEREFGLTPAARAGLAIRAQETGDEASPDAPSIRVV